MPELPKRRSHESEPGSPYKFTHAADVMARIVIANALFGSRGSGSALTIPWCTCIDPEIAHVGLYEAYARKRGLAVDTYTQPLSEVDRAILDGEEEGFVRVHVRQGSDTILGATVVARHAGEMISELTLTRKISSGRAWTGCNNLRRARRFSLSTAAVPTPRASGCLLGPGRR
ncbi:MAG: hypothetical protein HYY25_12045 [Candidatus Wallbacteria bacterium]|nr:hypothetical protein [Candidatus Wallbacteria bacterium]